MFFSFLQYQNFFLHEAVLILEDGDQLVSDSLVDVGLISGQKAIQGILHLAIYWFATVSTSMERNKRINE